jgi:hypothetical protein
LTEHGSDVGSALDAFARRRYPYGHAIVERARRLGAYMQAQVLTAEERAAAERFRTPLAVVTETAISPTA